MKLRRPWGQKPWFPGVWMTADKRFMLAREHSDGWSVRPVLWDREVAQAEQDRDWLHARGLTDARFPTRRAAVAALEVALDADGLL